MSELVEEAGKTSNDYLGMSDDDFLKINSPAGDLVETPATQGADQVETSDPTPIIEAEATGEDAVASEDEGAAVVEAGASVDAVVADVAAKPATTTEEAQPVEKQAAASEEVVTDYEGFFKQVMTPFKANGKTFELKTPDEAIRLMQMGAGYGRKIQELQPHLKVLRMLEKNDLLDESKLSFLIDVNQKNPDAIKKIIKDSGMDPLDLNMEDNAVYTPRNHAVSDNEVAFQSALREVQAHPTGQRTIQVINQTWDEESKAVLWDSPQLLEVIQSQRDNGVYDQITAEIDRQKILGQIPNATSFLQAYKIAGDHLQANNGFKPIEGQAAQIQPQPVVTPQPQVIATRTAAPKAQLQNGDKAAAASQTVVSTTRKASATVNPLEMADDVFMKQFAGRF